MKFPIFIFLVSFVTCHAAICENYQSCVLCVLDPRCYFVQRNDLKFFCLFKTDPTPVRKIFRRPNRCVLANQLMKLEDAKETQVETPQLEKGEKYEKPWILPTTTVMSSSSTMKDLNIVSDVSSTYVSPKVMQSTPIYSEATTPTYVFTTPPPITFQRERDEVTPIPVTTSQPSKPDAPPSTNLQNQTVLVLTPTPNRNKDGLSLYLEGLNSTIQFCSFCEKKCNKTVMSIKHDLNAIVEKKTSCKGTIMNFGSVPFNQKELEREIKRLSCRLAFLQRIHAYPTLMGKKWNSFYEANPMKNKTKRCRKFKGMYY